jgi:hypothetical protein
MREHSSWRLAGADELARRKATPLRPPGRSGMLVAAATNVAMTGPLLACNPKGGGHYTATATWSGGISDDTGWEDTEDDGYDSWGDGDGDGDGKLDLGGGDGDGDGDGDGAPCPTLSQSWPGDQIVVGPQQAAELPAIAAAASADTTILLLNGIYDLSGAGPIRLSQPGVSLRSVSNDRDTVHLDGGGVLDDLVVLEASYTSVAHLSLEGAKRHAIRVSGGVDANTWHTKIYDVAVSNPGKQAILIDRSETGYFADQGELGCSQIQLDDSGRAALVGCEIAGIDARGAQGWNVHDNRLSGWWCADAQAQPAIHFWQASRDTIVQRNVIEDSAEGIGFGYGEFGTDNERGYIDNPCLDPGHIGGIIRNNAIWSGDPELFASTHGVISGISLDRACAAQVLHNSVASLERPQVSIAYRWPTTDARIVNNLVTHAILPSAGASAQLEGNVADASLDNFVDPSAGDLHLLDGSPAIDAGVALEPGLADDDIDATARGDARDIGADELQD